MRRLSESDNGCDVFNQGGIRFGTLLTSNACTIQRTWVGGCDTYIVAYARESGRINACEHIGTINPADILASIMYIILDV